MAADLSHLDMCSTYRELFGAGSYLVVIDQWWPRPGSLAIPCHYQLFCLLTLKSHFSYDICITLGMVYTGIGEINTSLKVVSTQN